MTKKKKVDLGTSRKLRGWIGVRSDEVEDLEPVDVGRACRKTHCGKTRQLLVCNMLSSVESPVSKKRLKNYVAIRVDMILTPRGKLKGKA